RFVSAEAVARRHRDEDAQRFDLLELAFKQTRPTRRGGAVPTRAEREVHRRDGVLETLVVVDHPLKCSRDIVERPGTSVVENAKAYKIDAGRDAGVVAILVA